jgi:hypothetical protein
MRIAKQANIFEGSQVLATPPKQIMEGESVLSSPSQQHAA